MTYSVGILVGFIFILIGNIYLTYRYGFMNKIVAPAFWITSFVANIVLILVVLIQLAK